MNGGHWIRDAVLAFEAAGSLACPHRRGGRGRVGIGVRGAPSGTVLASIHPFVSGSLAVLLQGSSSLEYPILNPIAYILDTPYLWRCCCRAAPAWNTLARLQRWRRRWPPAAAATASWTKPGGCSSAASTSGRCAPLIWLLAWNQGSGFRVKCSDPRRVRQSA